MAENEALLPSVPGASSARPSSRGESSRSILTNRILSISTLLILLGVSIFFQWQVHQLAVQHTQDESQIHTLQDIVHTQAKVIERFNNSITNSDVLSRLDRLETDLTSTAKALKHDLEGTEAKIDMRLQDTLKQLNQTVEQAEDEIGSEVDKVKADVEQYVRTTQDQFSMENSFMVYQLAGTFTLLSCLISMWHMTAHLRRFNQPVVQRKILAILWMSPIYAITSWFSLVFHASEGYLAIVKDFYEAYVIYQFLSFCIAVLGRGDRNAVVDLLAGHADHLTPPFRFCGCFFPDPYETSRQLADAVLMQCQRFAMQFVFLRPLCTIALVVLKELNYYGRGTSATDYRSPQFYIVLVQNLSVFVAFTGLLQFYHAVDQDLQWCRPFAKFLCIKGVVFMTFWQGLALSILAQATDAGGDDAQEWARSAQNFLICLEMLLFSIAHFYCFPTEEWEEGYQQKHSENKFGDTIALGDFMHDLKLVLRSQSSKRRKSITIDESTTPEVQVVGEGDDDEGEHTDDDVEANLKTPPRNNSSSRMKGTYGPVSPEEDSEIQKILDRGSDVEDDEIEEATKRLLASALLQGDIDDIWNDDDELAGFNEAESGHDAAVDNRDNNVSNAPVGYGSNGVRPPPPPPPPLEETTLNYESSNETTSLLGNGQTPTETTSLLGNEYTSSHNSSDSLRSHNEELLQPSIFTTIADIDMQNRMNFS